MATFEFRRHSIKDGDKKGTVGARGKLFARAVGDQLMRNKRFDRYCVSGFERTAQTLEAFAEGAGWTDVKEKADLAPLYMHSPELQKMWDACREAQEQGRDIVAAAFDHDAGLAKRTSVVILELFMEWVLSLPREGHVLVIGHSPHLELLAYGISRGRLVGLKECEGFRIHTRVIGDDKDAGSSDMDVICLLETKADDCDPSALRRELFETRLAPDTVKDYARLWDEC